MSKGNDPAYGWKADLGGGVAVQSHGLTKRELIAAMVLQGLCAQLDTTMQGDVEASVKFADALLAELERTS